MSTAATLTAAPGRPPSPAAARLERVLDAAAPAGQAVDVECAPAASPVGQQQPAGQPESLAVAVAARRILNAVAESVLALTGQPSACPSAAQPDPIAGAVTLPEVLRCFLSDDERAILNVLARNPADRHMSATEVLALTGIEKSRFWTLWLNLQYRGLIREEGNGKRRYYVLGAEWLPLILS